jgi:arginine-tRNA-protein transferase
MYPPSRNQFRDFLKNAWGMTEYLVFRDENKKLVSVAVTDVFLNGLSAMYSFFDPSLSQRSLGVFNILFQILWARERELPFLYMGYWIEESRKMSYKTQYRPFQLFKDNQWITNKAHNSMETRLFSIFVLALSIISGRIAAFIFWLNFEVPAGWQKKTTLNSRAK